VHHPWAKRVNRRELAALAGQILPVIQAGLQSKARFSEMRSKRTNSKLVANRNSETVSSFPSVRRSANPAAAGGPAQLPARSDNATPSSAAQPDYLPRGVAQGGRGVSTDDLTTAPAPSFSRFSVRNGRVTFDIQEETASKQILSRQTWEKGR